jgi:hypothetical protein
MGQEADNLTSNGEMFSWAAFFEEIELLSPDHQTYVWNCDAKGYIPRLFLCEILGPPLRYLSASSLAKVDRSIGKVSVKSANFHKNTNPRLQEYEKFF